MGIPILHASMEQCFPAFDNKRYINQNQHIRLVEDTKIKKKLPIEYKCLFNLVILHWLLTVMPYIVKYHTSINFDLKTVGKTYK